ncbi:MAG: HAMP domain-containing sensor histidine kinase [bacterium]
MDAPGATRIKRLRRNLQLTGAIVLLSVGVLVPVLLSTGVGIITLVIGEGTKSIILGVLTISFASAAIGSGIIVAVLLGRRARTARFQADLLANVTHELRTPLSAIRMYAQTLQLGVLNEDPERTRTSVDTIIRETEWLEANIDRVLTWRAAAKDRFDLDMVAEPLGPLLHETVARFRRMLAPGDAELEVRVDSQLPVLHDKGGITAILLNLLINAFKYTGKEKRITLEATDGEHQVVIAISDNGIGISAKEHGRIFDPFYRVESRHRSTASGAGLGLAIVRHMVLAHAGQVFVESREGEGSKFTITLPEATTEEQR